MRSTMRVRFVSIILIMSMITALTGCSKPIDKFEKAIKKGDSSAAIEIYEDKIDGERDEEKEAIAFMKKYLSEALSDYSSGKISEKEFESRYKTIEKVNKKTKGINNLDETTWKYLSIKQSKADYVAGCDALNAEEYLKAYAEFSVVISDDTEHYKDAKSKISESKEKAEEKTISEAQDYATSGNYEDAITVIDNTIYVIGETSKLKDKRNEVKDSWETSVVDKAQNLANEGKYEDAYQILDEAMSTLGRTDKLEDTYSGIKTQEYESAIKTAYDSKNYISVFSVYKDAQNSPWANITDSMTNYYNTSITEYLYDVDTRAEAAFGENKDYEAALNVIKDAIYETDPFGIFEITDHLIDKSSYYEKYIPVKLSQDDAYSLNSYCRINGSYTSTLCKDGFGNTYDSDYVFTVTDSAWEDKPAQAKFYLAGEYNVMTGTVYVPYESIDPYGYGVDGDRYVRIYGDDVLLYEVTKTDLRGTAEPLQFSVDISGCSFVTIEIDGGWYKGDFTGRIPYYCVTNVCVSKA